MKLVLVLWLLEKPVSSLWCKVLHCCLWIVAYDSSNTANRLVHTLFINLDHPCGGEVLVIIVCLCVCVCVCLCVCVSVTALASTTNALKAKVRYQQKALDAGTKNNIGIELKILGSKVMTVISLP